MDTPTMYHWSSKSPTVNRYKHRRHPPPITNRVNMHKRASKQPCNATIIAIYSKSRTRRTAISNQQPASPVGRFVFYAVIRQIQKRKKTALTWQYFL